MTDEDLDLFLKNKIKEAVDIRDLKRIFRDVFRRVENNDRTIFYDFLGELLLEKSNFLEGKNYFKLIKMYYKCSGNIRKSKLLLLEKYFVEKYCIFEGEELLLSFLGRVAKGSANIRGRVFITNYRIFIIGRMQQQHIMPFTAGLVYHLIEFSMRKGLMKSTLGQPINGSMSKETFSFGYVFPIMNTKALKLEKNRVIFTSVIHDGGKETLFKIYIGFDGSYNRSKKNILIQKIGEIVQNARIDPDTSTQGI